MKLIEKHAPEPTYQIEFTETEINLITQAMEYILHHANTSEGINRAKLGSLLSALDYCKSVGHGRYDV